MTKRKVNALAIVCRWRVVEGDVLFRQKGHTEDMLSVSVAYYLTYVTQGVRKNLAGAL